MPSGFLSIRLAMHLERNSAENGLRGKFHPENLKKVRMEAKSRLRAGAPLLFNMKTVSQKIDGGAASTLKRLRGHEDPCSDNPLPAWIV